MVYRPGPGGSEGPAHADVDLVYSPIRAPVTIFRSKAQAMNVSSSLGQTSIEDFQRDGAVCLRQLLSADLLAVLREGIDWNLAHLSPRAKVASSPADPGYFVEDFCNWRDNPHYRRFIFDSPLAAVAGRLMGSHTARL